jgi:uncharacterized protein (DUF1778 family)
MDDQELRELEDPDSWDFENVQIHQPVAHRRAVVSVALSRDAFRDIASAARDCGMTVTGFVRLAAIEKAERLNNHSTRSESRSLDTADNSVGINASKP